MIRGVAQTPWPNPSDGNRELRTATGAERIPNQEMAAY